MKNSTKIICIYLILIMALNFFTITPITVSATDVEFTTSGDGESGITGNCLWRIEGTTLFISGDGKMGSYYNDNKAPWSSYIIKKAIIEEGVTNIGNYAFDGCADLESITIPSSVSKIETGFSSCTSLTGIYICSLEQWCSFSFCYDSSEQGLVYEGNNPLQYAHNLYLNGELVNELTIPVSVIGAYQFYGCTSITSVTIPDSVTTICTGAFTGCTNLTSVHISDLRTWCSICFGNGYGYYSNDGNPLLNAHNLYLNGELVTELTIPDSLTSINFNSFSGCTCLTSITVDPGNIMYDSRNNCNAIIESESNTLMLGCQNTIIPNSVKGIGKGAFTNCTEMTNITIPESVSWIDEGFSGCANLSGVYINDIGAWCSTRVGEVIHLFGGVRYKNYNPLTVASNLYLKGELVTDLIIPESVSRIGPFQFYGCTSLKSVTIPDSVTSIGDLAFKGCSNLTVIYGQYGSEAMRYANDNGIKFVVLKESTGNCFWNVIGTKLTISGNGKMGDYTKSAPWSDTNIIAFNDSNISEVIIEDGITNIGINAFVDCHELETIMFGNSVFGIAKGAFYRCEKLQSVVLPDSLEIIGSDAFSGCSGLTNINFPDSVTDIGEYAFYDCTAMKSATIPASVTNIDTKAFGYYWDDEFGLKRKLPGFKIYGDVGSEAHRYAKAYGFRFERAIAMTGDANGDYMVNVLDVTEIQHSLASMNTTTEEDLTKYADVDHNDMLDSVDAFIILRYSADIKTPYDEAIGQIQD